MTSPADTIREALERMRPLHAPVTIDAALAALTELEQQLAEAREIPGAELGWDGATTALERAEADRDRLADTLREIERRAGAAGYGEMPARGIAECARAALDRPDYREDDLHDRECAR